jgi:hypothetical protein
VIADSRSQADAAMEQGKPISWVAAVAIVAVWLLLAGLVILAALRALKG